MIESEKIAMLTAMTNETDDRVLAAYLSLAGNKVCRKAYPFDPSITSVPEQYEYVQLEVAAYMLNKRGAEGEKSHSENGITRTYEDGDIPPSLLREITPFASPIRASAETEGDATW